MKERSILVLGGTGKTGRRVVTQLRERDVDVRAASRSGEHPFDWDDRSTWKPALDGVYAAYLVDLQDKPGNWDAEANLRDFAGLAVSAGVRRLVLLQARVTDKVGGKSLIAGERAVQESGAEWTVLRPNWFAQNFNEGVLLDSVLAGELQMPAGNGVEPFIDVEDVAAVAVASLLEDGHSGQTYELTGPRALTMDEAVEEISRAIGRQVRYVSVSPEQYIADLVSVGVPLDYATFVSDLVGQIREGRNATLTGVVERVTDRPPRDFAGFVRSAAATGIWDA